jgi:hypothetical protein
LLCFDFDRLFEPFNAMQMEGSDIVNYGDTICVVGGFDELTKMARKSVSCWNPLQIGGDPDEEDGDLEEGRNKTNTKGNNFNNFVLLERWHLRR